MVDFVSGQTSLQFITPFLFFKSPSAFFPVFPVFFCFFYRTFCFSFEKTAFSAILIEHNNRLPETMKDDDIYDNPLETLLRHDGGIAVDRVPLCL